MVNQIQMRATVEEMRGPLRQTWADLTDEDIDRAEGRWDRVIATIRARTGAGVEAIEDRIHLLIDTSQRGPESRL